MPVTMLSPSPAQVYVSQGGASYRSDAFGLILNVPIGPDIRDLVTDGCVVLGSSILGRNNMAATTDPVVTNDGTQDYAPGSLWLNQTGGKLWTAISVGTGAAVWASGAVPVSPSFVNLTLSGLLFESAGLGITAGATRTQAGATVLTKEVNRIDTTTAPAPGTVLGDGVALMACVAGLDITIINNTANIAFAYPNGTDTINGLAAGVGVPLPPFSVEIFESAGGGAWHFDAGVGFAGYLPTMLSADSITANATGTQAASFALAADFNHILTAANTAAPFSAVSLGMAAKAGLDIYIENTAANPIQVFPLIGGTDNINGLAANASIVIPAFQTAILACTLPGQWVSNPYFNAVGSLPGNINTQMGSSLAASGAARPGGALSTVVVSAGVGNGADLTDDVLSVFSIPASMFDVAGRQLNIQAMGKTGATANNKRIKVFFNATTATVGSAIVGGTLIADSGVITANAQGWQANATVIKYGAAGANTQIAQGDVAVAGATRTIVAPALATAVESGVILVAVTGSSPTTGAAADVLGMVLNIGFNN